jgi:hypothetical protein
MRLAVVGLAAAVGLAFAPTMGKAQTNVVVTPFDLLAEHPLCKGPGTIAYRVNFLDQNINGRFGNVEDARPAVCSIRTRKGGEAMDIPIPCPESASENPSGAQAFALADRLSISADIVGCMTLTENKIVEARWTLEAFNAFGSFQAYGDLSAKTTEFLYAGPTFKTEGPDANSALLQPMWSLLVRNTPLIGNVEGGGELNLTTYVVFSPEPLLQKTCLSRGSPPKDCEPQPMTDWAMRDAFGSSAFSEAVKFVAGDPL